jgi:hypothetical protein
MPLEPAHDAADALKQRNDGYEDEPGLEVSGHQSVATMSASADATKIRNQRPARCARRPAATSRHAAPMSNKTAKTAIAIRTGPATSIDDSVESDRSVVREHVKGR